MTPWKGMCTCAVMLLAAGASPIQAAWCNVFEVCCPHRCKCQKPPEVVSHYYAPPQTCCASPCQQPCCQQYQARCYYEPVTSYQTKTYYEPVTSYRTSYYYEPVTSYRTSNYYDPCSCSYIQKSTPVTSYSLKAQVCPVQTWVERCTTVPVTSYRQSFYWEPVNPCPTACPTCPSQPGASLTPGGPPPGVSVTPGTPSGSPQPGVTVYPSGTPESFRPAPEKTSDRPGSQQGVQLERVVALPAAKSNIEGQVVCTDYTPKADTEVIFVLADRKEVEHRVTTNKDGEFRASLTEGRWDVYVKQAGGNTVLQKRIDVGPKAQLVTLLSK
jgi:hypothetical protein